MAPPRQSTGSAIVRFYDPDVQAKDAFGRTQEQILSWNNSQLENSHNYIQMLFPLPEGSPYNWSAPVIDLDTMKAFRAKSELRQRLRKSFERMLTFYGFTMAVHPEVDSEDEKDVEKQEHTTTDTEWTSISATVPSTEEGIQDAQTPSAATSKATTTENATEATTAEQPSTKPEAPRPISTSKASPFGYHVVRGPNWREASRNWCVRMDHNHLRITRILRCLRVLGLQTECDAFFLALKRVYNDPAIQIGENSMMFWTRAVERSLYIAPDNDKCEWLKAWEEQQE